MFNFLISVLSQEWMFFWSRPSIDVVEPTGVELLVHIVWQCMLAVGQSLSMEWQQPKSVNGVAATKVCRKWQHMISLSGMAAYEMT